MAGRDDKTKPALAARRALDVLNHFTLHPRKSFTLSELSAALKVSPSSMTSVLRAMTDAGYVVRDERHKAYEIGPALVAAGHAAALGHPVTRLASPEMERLAQFGTECIGSAPVGEEFVILAVAGRPSGKGQDVRVGQRLPLMPPFGQIFLAWADETSIARWLAQAPDSARETLAASLETIREKGYAVVLENEPVIAVQNLIVRSARRPVDMSTQATLHSLIPTQINNYTLSDSASDAVHRVHNMIAPVFDENERVVYGLTIQGIGDVTREQIADIGNELLASTRALTRAIGGAAPAAESLCPILS